MHITKTSTKKEIKRAHCNACGGERNHQLLMQRTKTWRQDVHLGGEYFVSGGDLYYFLECMGCEQVKLLHEVVLEFRV